MNADWSSFQKSQFFKKPARLDRKRLKFGMVLKNGTNNKFWKFQVKRLKIGDFKQGQSDRVFLVHLTFDLKVHLLYRLATSTIGNPYTIDNPGTVLKKKKKKKELIFSHLKQHIEVQTLPSHKNTSAYPILINFFLIPTNSKPRISKITLRKFSDDRKYTFLRSDGFSYCLMNQTLSFLYF